MPTNHHLGTIAQLCPAISPQLRHVSTIGKKLAKQQYLHCMFSQYGELRPTNGWHLLASLRHPSKFQRVSRLCFTTAPTSLNGGQQNFAGCLTVSWLVCHISRVPCTKVLSQSTSGFGVFYTIRQISTSPTSLWRQLFTARRYASAVLAVVVCPSVCLPVCLSVCHKPVLYRNGNT